MKFDMGKELNAELNFLIYSLDSFYHQHECDRNIHLKKRVKGVPLQLIYSLFVDELKGNIQDYHNPILITEYLNICFESFLKWEAMDFFFTDQLVVRNQYEVQFLLRMKHAIEMYQIIIPKWMELTTTDSCDKTILLQKFNNIQLEIGEINFDEDADFWDFDINTEYKIERNSLLKHVQISKRTENGDWKFVEMFQNELKEFQPHIDEGFNTVSKPETVIPKAESAMTYHWDATDTDLIELSVAMLKIGAIQRTDGKQMTQKEMIGVFENMFGFHIKDAKGKLATAVGRKKNVTPFLDRLKAAFENYRLERDEK